MDQQPRIEVNWIQVLAGALAAVSSAVLLSTVGVAGTIIGAAAGSVAATVGAAIYSYYLAASRERVLAARALALRRVARAQSKPSGSVPQPAPVPEPAADRAPEPAADPAADPAGVDREPGQQSDEPMESEAGADQPVSWRKVLGKLSWRKIAVVSVAIFALAMAAILTFELLTGRAVSTYTGGTSDDGRRTTIPFGGRDDANEKPTDVRTPSAGTSDAPTGVAPTETPAGSDPTVSPTPETTGSTPGDPTSVPPTSEQPGVEPTGTTSTVAPTDQTTP